MVTARLLFVVLCALAAWPAAYGQAVPDVDDFYVDGIHVVLRPNVQNEVVSVILFLQGGVINQRGHNPMLELYALSLPAASGPATMSKDLYRAVTSRMFTVIGANNGRDYSDMSCVCVKEFWNTSWDVFAEVLMHPRYDTVEFERMRRQSQLNLESRPSNPDTYVRFLAESLAFGGHLYFSPVAATDIAQLSIDSIAAYHDELFIKSRMLLVVVGNVSRDDLVQKIRATISALPMGNYVDYAFRTPAQFCTPNLVMRQQPLPTLYIMGLFGMPRETDFDHWAAVIATSILSSRIFDNLRVRRNLTYASSVEHIGGKVCYGKLYLTTEFPDSCLPLIKKEIQYMMDFPPSQTEINYHINLNITQLGQQQETNISQADAIGSDQIVTLSWRNAYTVIDRLRELAPADIQRCAQRYFRNMTFGVVGDTTKIQDKAIFAW